MIQLFNLLILHRSILVAGAVYDEQDGLMIDSLR